MTTNLDYFLNIVEISEEKTKKQQYFFDKQLIFKQPMVIIHQRIFVE